MKIDKIASISDDSTTPPNAMKTETWPIRRFLVYARISQQAIDAPYPLEKRAA